MGASGKWMTMTAAEAISLLEQLASQGYVSVETTVSRGRGMIELDSINMLTAKVNALAKLITKSQVNVMSSSTVSYELCGGSHLYHECNATSEEQVNFLQRSYNQRNGPMPNAFNHQWRNHPGFS